MTNQEYSDLFGQLADTVRERGEVDADIFLCIFNDKIVPIIRNAFAELGGVFSYVDLEDVKQTLFIKLWKKSVLAYFANESYQHTPSWFLGWCRVVVKNYLTSLLRKRSEKHQLTIDDPDHPIVVSCDADYLEKIIIVEKLKDVFSAVLALKTKIEIKLTWLEVYLMIYGGAALNRIEATHIFCEKYADKTFSELSEDVLRDLSSSSFIADPETWKDAIEGEIAKKSGDVPKADVTVGELLGDEPLARVSDWIYKVNSKLAELEN